jgi:hypothetical protein
MAAATRAGSSQRARKSFGFEFMAPSPGFCSADCPLVSAIRRNGARSFAPQWAESVKDFGSQADIAHHLKHDVIMR